MVKEQLEYNHLIKQIIMPRLLLKSAKVMKSSTHDSNSSEDSFVIEDMTLREPEPEANDKTEYDHRELRLKGVTIGNSRFIAKYLDVHNEVV